MGMKEKFYKIETPWELLEFMKKNKDFNYDKDMIKHFNELARKFSNGETRENHSDPREAFRKNK